MFNFMGKKEKKSRKGTSSTGGEELETIDKLEEVRRSLKIRSGRRKEKVKLPSGITADYSSAFFAQLDVDRGSELDRGNDEVITSNTTTIIDLNNGDVYERQHQHINTSSMVSATFISHSDNSSENSINLPPSSRPPNLPPVPPRIPKRGILKGSKTSLLNINDSDSRAVLMRNTLQNERMGDEVTINNQLSPNHNMGQQYLNIMTTPSPSAESLTDTTNSSFATPPFSLSPVGEAQGLYSWSRIQKFDDVSLPLPAIKLVQLPPPRELIITRRKTPTHDFGFSLRKAIVLDRSESLFIPISRPVIFAEPGTNAGNSTGLLPGDRLMKVNRQPVEELARESIIEMIRNSGDSVIVEVQPVAELVELSRRCMPKEDTNQDEMDRSTQVSDCNTLRRSASKRFKSHY
ncbi:CLUMA_CG015282, isoform A [Clunio marinus]|uniref:CLUMA_CG015282, isoform A n=1 Tax=Clunio marinus TaxID=568069 RepID=A0A1J1INQ2_9DIPT|nr:CLUMA_CG015282, isoform A [Clunio marinus]